MSFPSYIHIYDISYIYPNTIAMQKASLSSNDSFFSNIPIR
jgi:hypothetical protein